MFTDGSAPPGGPREIANSRFPAAGLAHLLEDQQFASVTLLRPSPCRVWRPGRPASREAGRHRRQKLARFLDSPLSPPAATPQPPSARPRTPESVPLAMQKSTM